MPSTAILWTSDEVDFHVSGCVNNNFRYWVTELLQHLLHSSKVPFFEEGGVTVTVNSDGYCGMLENFFEAKDLRVR